jgi:hypothetical protein
MAVKKQVHPLDVVATSDGRTFVFGRHKNDYSNHLLIELVKDKPVLVETYPDAEGVAANGREIYVTGERVRRFDGKAWKTLEVDVDIHSPAFLDGKLVGVGRDGAVGMWNKTSWKKLAPATRDLHLTGIANDGGTWVVCGSKGSKGVVFAVAANKLAPIKIPASGELLAIATLPDGQLLVTGENATALLGPRDALKRLPAGKRTASFGNAVGWDQRVVVAGRKDGVLELANGELSTFSKEPAQRLVVAAGRLWRLDLSGLSWWDNKAWKKIDAAV